MSDIALHKKESIERCIKQIRAYRARPSDLPFADDHYKQDAIAANLQRLADLSIDLANHVVKHNKLGLPKESRESFRILGRAGLLPQEQVAQLEAMVGLRNILVHQYSDLDLDLFQDVIDNKLASIIDFTNAMLQAVL